MVYEYGEIGSWADKFVVICLLGEGFDKQLDFVLQCGVVGKGAHEFRGNSFVNPSTQACFKEL